MLNAWGKIKELINRPYIVEQGNIHCGQMDLWFALGKGKER